MPQVNISFQILPFAATTQDRYAIVDKAIAIIAQSGLKYEVCPFETVIEGEYEQVMQLIGQAQEVCLAEGVEILAYLKIHRKNQDVNIEDKMQKYRT